jgi:hypothetical protein
MPDLDDELRSNAELRLSIKDVLSEALSRCRKSIGFKSLTREQRRGMFATHVRTCVTEHPKLYSRTGFYTRARRSSRLIYRVGDKSLHKSVVNHIIAPDLWYDAGMLREQLPGYLESSLLRSIMEDVMKESENGENAAKTSLKKLEGGVSQMEMNLAEMNRMTSTLDTESKRLTAELNKL